MPQSKLDIFVASAGAGKTYSLTEYYLRLLLVKKCFAGDILAVTFTNKATEEMKRGIINRLYHLIDTPSDPLFAEVRSAHQHKTDSDTSDYIRRILSTLLNDYSSFRISTIDKFFQSVLRTFVRDLDLPDDFMLELDEEAIYASAIEGLFASLVASGGGENQVDYKHRSKLLSWLSRLSEERVMNGKGWDVRRDLHTLMKELSKEQFRINKTEIINSYLQEGTLDTLLTEVETVIDKHSKKMREFGKKGLAILRKHSIEIENFSQKSSSAPSYFRHLAKGELTPPAKRFWDLRDKDACKWVTAGTKRNPSPWLATVEAMEDEMKALVEEFEQYYTAGNTAYNSAIAVQAYSYKLGLLSDLLKQQQEYKEERGILLIADTTELINRLVDNTEIPFIYERIGARIKHYMIDEFQDTSLMQWHNFMPLLKDSLDSHHDNMLVGDTKQSIYRFRNSNWRLLGDQVKKKFSENYKETMLEFNWRSSPAVVEFNNQFFASVVDQLTHMDALHEELKEKISSSVTLVYNTFTQKIPPAKQNAKGKLQLTYLTDEAREEDDQTDQGEKKVKWKVVSMQMTYELIRKLQHEGCPLRDITLLVKNKKEGAMIASYLLSQKEPIALISDESLLLRASLTIKLVVSAMACIEAPEEKMRRTALAILILERRREIAAVTPAHEQKGVRIEEPLNEVTDKIIEVLIELDKRSLYDLSIAIIHLLRTELTINEHEAIYMQAFMDLVIDYSSNGRQDVSEFLAWWDKMSDKYYVQQSCGSDAVSIMTIHKSKGLGFSRVIIPFCDWKLGNNSNKDSIIWASCETTAFNCPYMIPIKYSDNLYDSYFRQAYIEEKMLTMIDQLNALYVALTRAKDEMYLFVPAPSKNSSPKNKELALPNVARLFSHYSAEDILITSGEDAPPATDEMPPTNDATGDGAMAQHWDLVPLGETKPNRSRFTLKLPQTKEQERNSPQQYGILIHRLFEQAKSASDLPSLVEEYRQEGRLTDKMAQSLSKTLRIAMDNPLIASWFENVDRVMTERAILLNGRHYIPDRVVVKRDGSVVVIDYKLGEVEMAKYLRQVKQYITLLRKIVHNNVRGYLWYITLNKVVSVE